MMDNIIQPVFSNIINHISAYIAVLGYILLFFMIIQPIIVLFSIRSDRRKFGDGYKRGNGYQVEESKAERKRRYIPYPIRLWGVNTDNEIDKKSYKILAVFISFCIIFGVVNAIFWFVFLLV